VSIVLALGIADILRFIADTFRESGDRKIYWVHLVWIFLLLELHVEFWWRMWSFRDMVVVGPILGFLLLGPALLFVATRTLLPASASDADLHALYFRRKTLFFILMVLLNIWSLIASPWGLGETSREGMTGTMIVFAVVMILFIASIFSSNRLLHYGVVSMVVTLELLDIIAVM
jgi:hypothetical protein